MKTISPIFVALTIGAAAIGIPAPAAATETSNCQSIGKTMVCAQGNVTAGAQSTRIQSNSASNGPAAAPASGEPSAPASAPTGDSCTDAYGAPINCNHT